MVDFISFRPHVGRTIHLCELQANLIQARVQNRPNCGGPRRIREQNPLPFQAGMNLALIFPKRHQVNLSNHMFDINLLVSTDTSP